MRKGLFGKNRFEFSSLNKEQGKIKIQKKLTFLFNFNFLSILLILEYKLMAKANFLSLLSYVLDNYFLPFSNHHFKGTLARDENITVLRRGLEFHG